MPKQTFFNLPQAKKDQIITAATNEFVKAPYQDISINHLIKCMEIPTGSFYQYFEDKKDLYFFILSSCLDGLLEESVSEHKKLNLLSDKREERSTATFTKTRQNMKFYNEIFVENFNKAPLDIKREWTFEYLIGQKFMTIYDYSFFDAEGIDPLIRENKYLMMAFVMVIPTILQSFCERSKDPERYAQLYDLSLKVLKKGCSSWSAEEEKR